MSPADLPHGAASAIGNHWESVGLLVRGGHLDRRLAYTSMSYEIQYDGATLAAFVENTRTVTGMSAINEHFEWLAGQMAAINQARGGVVVFDDAYLAKRRPGSLQSCRDQIRIYGRLKVVHVRNASEAEAPDEPKRGAIAPGGAVA